MRIGFGKLTPVLRTSDKNLKVFHEKFHIGWDKVYIIKKTISILLSVLLNCIYITIFQGK